MGGWVAAAGGSHTCRVLLEMKETFELLDLDLKVQLIAETHARKCARGKAHTLLLVPPPPMTHQMCVLVIKKRRASHLYSHTPTHTCIWRGDSLTATVGLSTPLVKPLTRPSQRGVGSERYYVRDRCGQRRFPQSTRSA